MAVLEPGVFAPSPCGYDGNVVNEALPLWFCCLWVPGLTIPLFAIPKMSLKPLWLEQHWGISQPHDKAALGSLSAHV